ncbi:argininosuccinate synthase [Flavobacteriaceae bacterium]|nr:argininosuccinate synthase [Flavobacteriaceae bacterium]
MKRRQFIKLTSTASAVSMLPFEIQASMKLVNSFYNCDVSNRKLILVELNGGNDGLNTVIPISTYTDYQTLRPNIHIPSSLFLPLNNIDSNLTGTNQDIALHPELTGFYNLYAQDQLRIIQSVGYPSQNKSHFGSQDIYATGNDGNNWVNGDQSGWIGRFMEYNYADTIPTTYPLGIQVGSNTTSLGFHGEIEHGLALNLSGQDSENFYSVLSGLAGAPPNNIPSSDYGSELQYIIDTDILSNQYSQVISTAFNNGANSTTSNYPDTNLADQLKTVARLIRGGIETKVFMVKLGGFDTHNNQNQASGDIHVGDTIVGIKGRVGFEAPAALIIVKAHHLLEKHTLTKWQLQHKDYLSNFYGMHLHEGQYLDPVMRDMEAFLTSSQSSVSGIVEVVLKPYHFSINGVKSPNDLMNAKFGSYGEVNSGWTAEEAKGFIKINGNQNKIHQQVNSNA